MLIEEKQLPDIFEYNDFRKYLVDYQEARQFFEKDFSKSEFSRRMQLPNTRSYINDVLNGKKVSNTFIERFISAMELSKGVVRDTGIWRSSDLNEWTKDNCTILNYTSTYTKLDSEIVYISSNMGGEYLTVSKSRDIQKFDNKNIKRAVDIPFMSVYYKGKYLIIDNDMCMYSRDGMNDWKDLYLNLPIIDPNVIGITNSFINFNNSCYLVNANGIFELQ